MTDNYFVRTIALAGIVPDDTVLVDCGVGPDGPVINRDYLKTKYDGSRYDQSRRDKS